MLDLNGKVAIVTGSTKGIGVALARRLVDAGASVTISSRSQGDIDTVVEQLGERTFGVVADVSDPAACQRLIDATVERFGRLDILVNNAGHGIMKPMAEMTVQEWQAQVDVNLGGVFYSSKAALAHLSATGDGFIINIASLAARNPFAGGTGYNASKFGLLGLTEAMMQDIRHDDVRVSLVMPGSVNTQFQGREQNPERGWKLEADDCARAVMQILSLIHI